MQLLKDTGHICTCKLLQRQSDRLIGQITFVDGKHNFKSFGTLLAGNQRRTVVPDGFQHIAIQTGMAIAIEIADNLLFASRTESWSLYRPALRCPFRQKDTEFLPDFSDKH